MWCSVFLKPFRKKWKRACDKQRLQLSRRETSFLCPILRFFFPLTKILKNKLICLLPVQKYTWSFSSFDISLRGGGGVYFHTAAHGNKSYHFYQLVPGWGNIRDRPEGRAGGGGLYPPLFRKNKNKLDKNNGAKNSPPTKNLLRGP